MTFLLLFLHLPFFFGTFHSRRRNRSSQVKFLMVFTSTFLLHFLQKTHETKLFDIFLPVLHLDWCFLSPPLTSREQKPPAKSITPMLIGEPFRWPFYSFFYTYHSSLAHSTVGEGTEALKWNSWWFLLRPFFCIFFKKLMIASLWSKRSFMFQRIENLLFIHCDVM